MTKDIFILGFGEFTPVCIDLATNCGYSAAGIYYHDSSLTGRHCHGIRIIGSYDDLFSQGNLDGRLFMLSMGNGSIRAKLFERIRALGGGIPTLIHPTAEVSQFASVSEAGVQIGPFSLIQAESCIGEDTMILSHVNISHTASIGSHCLVSGHSSIGTGTHIGNYVEIGMGAIAAPHKVKVIGDNSVVGAGSVLVSDVPPNSVVAGNPAKVIR